MAGLQCRLWSLASREACNFLFFCWNNLRNFCNCDERRTGILFGSCICHSVSAPFRARPVESGIRVSRLLPLVEAGQDLRPTTEESVRCTVSTSLLATVLAITIVFSHNNNSSNVYISNIPCLYLNKTERHYCPNVIAEIILNMELILSPTYDG